MVLDTFAPSFWLHCGRPVWQCSNRDASDALENLQRRMARVVMKYADSDEVMSHLRWQTLSNQCTDHVLKLLKKSMSHVFNRLFHF